MNLIRLFVAVLLLAILSSPAEAMLATQRAQPQTQPLPARENLTLYCAAAYFALFLADMRGDEYGRFMAMGILASSC